MPIEFFSLTLNRRQHLTTELLNTKETAMNNGSIQFVAK